MKYDWKKSILNFKKDIKEYLKEKYDDYCKDTNEYSVDREDWYRCQNKIEHYNKQDRLIKFGFKLKEKLRDYPEIIRKHIFEEIGVSTNIEINRYFNDKQEELLKKYNNDDLLKQKEEFEQYAFIRNIDDFEIRRITFIKKRKKEKVEEEVKRKKEVKEEARRNILNERRKGFSNIKPLSFYKEKYKYNEDNSKFETEDDNKCYKEEQQEIDKVFQETGLCEHDFFKLKRFEIYTSVDSPEENQKILNRCKEINEIVLDLILLYKFFEFVKPVLSGIEILQKYLTEGYLITIQIASLVFRLEYWLKFILSYDINTCDIVLNHPVVKYNINLYSDNYNIIKIKEDISEFVRINEGRILTPFECLKVYLKKHDNKISIKDYELFTKNTNIVARRILNEFVKKNKLKWKKEGSNHELIYFI